MKFTNKLEKMHRSALPSAIRGTLNKAAFDVKQRTMPASVDKTFVKRNPTFFKANSRVEMAKGFDVKTMASTVGFTSHNLKYNNFAVQELEEQEYGGRIRSRSFIPLGAARSGNSSSKPVLPSNRLRKIRKVVDSNRGRGVSRSSKFVRAAMKAGRGGFVIGNFARKTLFKITSISKDEDGKPVITKIPIYSFLKGRSVGIKSTRFMRNASDLSASKLEKFYIEEAERQFAKIR